MQTKRNADGIGKKTSPPFFSPSSHGKISSLSLGGIFFGFGMFSIFKILCYHGFNYIRLKAFEASQAPYAYAFTVET